MLAPAPAHVVPLALAPLLHPQLAHGVAQAAVILPPGVVTLQRRLAVMMMIHPDPGLFLAFKQYQITLSLVEGQMCVVVVSHRLSR